MMNLSPRDGAIIQTTQRRSGRTGEGIQASDSRARVLLPTAQVFCERAEGGAEFGRSIRSYPAQPLSFP